MVVSDVDAPWAARQPWAMHRSHRRPCASSWGASRASLQTTSSQIEAMRTAAGSCVVRAVLPSPREPPAIRPATSTAPAAASRAGAAARLVRTAAADKAGGGFDSGGAMWGGRFEEGVSNIVERFGESVSFDKKLYKQVGRPHAHSAHAVRSTSAHRSSFARGLSSPGVASFLEPAAWNVHPSSPRMAFPACGPVVCNQAAGTHWPA